MISYFNQLDFDLFITTVTDTQLFETSITYRELIRVTGFSRSEKAKLLSDLQIVDAEIKNRKQ